ELSLNRELMQINIRQICSYDQSLDTWSWDFTIGEDKRRLGAEEDAVALEMFEERLRSLSQKGA
ncbi:MAG: hypothetical protein K0Q48_2352, partial [Bacillota bacterium]|nr:hypothetical protein [Bacillota bacterium]